ncbi:MAG: SDR family oxidoreductase [Syntrophorhabdales bacterium]|jgi:3-oxoacyl-[acyl-carrier protein] reductase|nr:SDR family oxidoreductase [Syntrophorhabdales bacterium]
MRLKNKVAILTAAAGAGIGKATARTFAREGAHVVITDAHEERSRQAAHEISKEFAVKTIGIRCDVLILQDIREAVRATLDMFGRIDILFNNAGTNRPAPIIDMTDENWDIVMGVSLRSVFYFSREVLPVMIKQQSGRIISMTSVAGFRGLAAGHAHYAAAKAGVMAFTRCLAMEAAPHRITANTIAPSFIYNEFIPNLYPEEEIQRMFDEIPYPRKGVPQDVANTALFLASDEGEYITGQTICVTGGSWMR